MTTIPIELRPAPAGDHDGPTAVVTLLRPPIVVLLKSLSYVGPMPSIGLAYVAAALRSAGHDVRVVDGLGEAIDDTVDFDTEVGTMRRIGMDPAEMVERIDPASTVIGITHMFLHEWPQVRELAELVRERFPDATIVLGGENATSFWPWIFEDTDAVDCCVLGEGETTVVELVGRLAAGVAVDDLDGLAIHPGSRLGRPADEPRLPRRIRRLTEIPRPAWDLFPVETYLSIPDTLGVDRGRTLPMVATRGCPYKCSFCSAPAMWTTRYTVREPVDLVDEIEEHVRTYGVQNIDFVDLTAMTKRKWMLEFCDELERRDLGISWQLPVGTRSEGIDEHVLERLHASGCRNMTFAPEHGSPRMLEVFDKRLDLDHILDSIRACRRIGIVTHVNTIIGHPAETWNDRWKNLVFLMRAAWAGCDTGSAIMFHPYPGSRDFRELLEQGRLTPDETFLYDGITRGAPAHHSWNDSIGNRILYLCQLAMVGAFVLTGVVRHPSRVVHFVRALRGGEERTHYEQGVRIKRDARLSPRRRPAAPSAVAR